MRRSIVSMLAGLSICIAVVGISRGQQAAEKAAQGTAATQAADAKQEKAAAPARPGDAAKQPAEVVDPSGSWKWDIELGDGNKLEFVLKLNWDGKKLDGSYASGKGTPFEATAKVEEGKVDKDAVTFVTRPEVFGNKIDIKFSGKTKKDEITGNTNLDFGQGPQDFPWTAKRFVDADDVVGVWDLTIEAANFGPVQSVLTVTKDDKGLRAKYKSTIFDNIDAKSVQIKDNDLLFEIASPADAELAFKSQYRGTPRGNTIEGKSNYDIGGNTGESKFTGKKQPKEEKKAEPARPEAARPAADAKDSKDAKQSAGAAKSDGK